MTISLEYHGRQQDYQVPSGVSLSRLDALMHLTLGGDHLPEAWTLQLKGQTTGLEPSDLFKQHIMGDGDVFSIVPIQETRKESWNENL
ncbi:hypothetical protein OfM1_16190 [Lactovum odontotermitis]